MAAIFGDLRQDQDPNFSNGASGPNADQIDSSGFSKEAKAHIFAAPNNLAVQLAFDRINVLSSPPAAVNHSAGFGSDDPQCLGQSALSQDANDLYEDGIAYFKSAGNGTNSSTTDCMVGSPGSAMGAFTVGAHDTNTDNGETSVRSDTIANYSSRGGTSSEGGARTIIDLTGYGERDLLFNASGGYRSDTVSGTSFATPTVTAAAINTVDFYRNFYSFAIEEDPGFLYVALLLMGDRAASNGTSKMTSQYNNLFGAGRLQARKWDTAGMDTPWGHYAGAVCVDDDEIVSIPVNSGNALSSDVNVFKAVICARAGRLVNPRRAPAVHPSRD